MTTPSFSMPSATAGLTDEQRAFLSRHGIGISNGYVGMLRAYRQNRTIWQTSAWTPILAAMGEGSGGSRFPIDEIMRENDAQLRAWVDELMGLADTDLAARFDTHIPLFS